IVTAALGEITGAEPAVLGEGVAVRVVVLVVAGESERTSHLQLALLRDAQLRPRAGTAGAGRSGFGAVGGTRVERRLQLGHAPELRDGALRQPRRKLAHQSRRRHGTRHDGEPKRGPVVLVE